MFLRKGKNIFVMFVKRDRATLRIKHWGRYQHSILQTSIEWTHNLSTSREMRLHFLELGRYQMACHEPSVAWVQFNSKPQLTYRNIHITEELGWVFCFLGSTFGSCVHRKYKEPSESEKQQISYSTHGNHEKITFLGWKENLDRPTSVTLGIVNRRKIMLSVDGLQSTNFTPASVQLSFHLVPKEFPDQSTKYHVRGLESSFYLFSHFCDFSDSFGSHNLQQKNTLIHTSVWQISETSDWICYKWKALVSRDSKNFPFHCQQKIRWLGKTKSENWKKADSDILSEHVETSRVLSRKLSHIVWFSTCTTSATQPRSFSSIETRNVNLWMIRKQR